MKEAQRGIPLVQRVESPLYETPSHGSSRNHSDAQNVFYHPTVIRPDIADTPTARNTLIWRERGRGEGASPGAAILERCHRRSVGGRVTSARSDPPKHVLLTSRCCRRSLALCPARGSFSSVARTSQSFTSPRQSLATNNIPRGENASERTSA